MTCDNTIYTPPKKKDGTLSVTENGVYDVTEYASADVNVSGGGDYDIYGNLVIFNGNTLQNYKVGDLTVPNSITKLSDYAFMGYHADHIYLPSGINSVSQYCFQYATIVDMEIPEGVTNIGFRAFSGCTQLLKLILPSTVTSISNYFVENCDHLANLTIKAVNPPSISSNTFRNLAGATTIYVPADSVSAYKSASYWSSIAGKIQAIQE